MKNMISAQEHARVKKELSKATKKIEKLSDKLEKANKKIDSANKELKKTSFRKTAGKKAGDYNYGAYCKAPVF